MSQSRHHAIFIGVSAFDDKEAFQPLPCAANDVEAMVKLLTDSDFALFSDPLVFRQETDDFIRRKINRVFKDAKRADQIFIYYSGHGKLDDEGHLHLVTANTEADLLESTSIPAKFLREMIDKNLCKQVMLILDCCYSGAVSKDFHKGQVEDQLTVLAERKGIYILTASTSAQPAKGKEADQYSLLTKHILHGIQQGKADYDRDGYVSMVDLYEYVKDQVPREAAQTPTSHFLDIQGERLYVARAASLYSAEQLQAFKRKINELDNADALPAEIINHARTVIAANQQKQDKAFFDLLHRLCEKNLGLWPFQQMWLAQVGQASSGPTSTPPPPKPKPATPKEVSETGLPDLYSIHNMPRPSARNKPTSEPTKTKKLSLTPFKFTTVTLNAGGEEVERRTLQARQFVEELAPGVQLEMVEIPDGKFMMGSPKEEANSYDDERPRLEVTVAPFYLGKFTITQAQWRVIAADKSLKVKIDLEPEPAHFKGDDRPVERVNWDDAQEFCARLAKKTGRGYRLPSESEWEYACRAGTTTPFAFGETITPEIVNYNGEYPYAEAPKGKYRRETIPVGSLGVANAWGLFDMHGNVWEWCEDVWHDSYKGAPSMSTAWTLGGNSDRRVLRGGAWLDLGLVCRSAFRYYDAPGDRYGNFGFRVVVAARTT